MIDCKRMLPIWSELSSSHNGQKKFIIAKVDCTIDIELCSNEDILGYPTFVFYKKGSSIGIRYNENQLTTEAFELFMFNQAYKKVRFLVEIDLIFIIIRKIYEMKYFITE